MLRISVNVRSRKGEGPDRISSGVATVSDKSPGMTFSFEVNAQHVILKKGNAVFIHNRRGPNVYVSVASAATERFCDLRVNAVEAANREILSGASKMCEAVAKSVEDYFD